MTTERERFIVSEIERVKRAGCQFEIGDVLCGEPVEVETMTEVRGTWLLISCDVDESHHRTERV